MLRIMTIGDVTSPKAATALADRLWEIRRNFRIDFLAVNPENAGFIIGPSADAAKMLLDKGADLLTGGNHTLQNQSLHALLDSDNRLIRPANLPAEAPGVGYTVLSANGYRLLAINVLGRVEMEPICDSPFTAIEKILSRENGNYDLSILDVHAEASGEKVALAVCFASMFDNFFLVNKFFQYVICLPPIQKAHVHNIASGNFAMSINILFNHIFMLN